jgi:hypothetical protein
VGTDAAGLKISGFVQAQYNHNNLSTDQLQNGTPLNQDQFMVRRGRLRADRTWDYAAFALELDANTSKGPKVGIRRAEGSLFYRGDNPTGMPPLAMLSAGIIDIPFGFELAETARVRYFMERTIANGALFPTEMDLGARLSGGVSVLRYAVAVMNGQPGDDTGMIRDPNAAKDVIGRVGVDAPVGKDLSLVGGGSFAVGKGFHAGQDAGKPSLTWKDANGDGVVQPNEITGVAATAAVPSQNYQRWALGLDLGATLTTELGRTHVYGEAFVASNFDRGYVVSDPIVTGGDAKQASAVLAVTQELTPSFIVGLRGSIYDPNTNLFGSRAGKSPRNQNVRVLSPLVGFILPKRARLLFEYDFVRDHQATTSTGSLKDADNDQWTVRLQVEL